MRFADLILILRTDFMPKAISRFVGAVQNGGVCRAPGQSEIKEKCKNIEKYHIVVAGKNATVICEKVRVWEG
ncbi:hypothetical protein APX81_06735 [Escherichia coli]|nr:hypothetical protein [Escherichia coli]EEW6031788.1 hypothetical protein [Escherichia coli]EFN9261316.1 hypothetical protein [Escherichia coli]KIH32542.1 hypothetical protein PU13_02765 [Escherichia coli]PAZ24372.1 hypothetical protein APU33_17625 [Escherichia coli]